MSTPSPSAAALPLRGACLCGAVRYEVDAPVDRVTHCHCSMCRRAHGAAFGSYATLPSKTFRIVQGEDALRSYSSSPGITRRFCAECGSPISWQDEARSHEIGFTMGTLESAVPVPAQWHIYAASKAPWYVIDDHLPQWPGRKPPGASPDKEKGDTPNE